MIKLPTVVNVRGKKPCDVYIGRAVRGYKCSIWHNPFKENEDGTPEEILEKYMIPILNTPELLKRLPELSGKRLGCYCVEKPINSVRKDKVCHGEILLELFHTFCMGER